MEISTQIDAARRLRSHRVRGTLTFDEIRDALQAVYESPEFRPDFNVLWDLRGADLTGVTAEQVQAIAGLAGTTWGTEGRPRAAIVVSREFDFGLARQYELRIDAATAGDVMVFRDLEEAVAWVGGATETDS